MKKRKTVTSICLCAAIIVQLAAWPAVLSAAPDYFHPAINYSVGLNTKDVYAADFDKDGLIDLAAANYSGDDSLSILTGQADGAFAPAVHYAAGWFVSSVDGADFNGDGNIDLVVANQHQDRVSVLLGNGDGTFQAAVSYTTGESPLAALSGDFNGDGYPDIVSANYDDSSVSILLGNGDGTFQPKVDYAVDGPMDIIVADLNGDGHADIAVTSSYVQSGVNILYGNGDGTFDAPVYYYSGTAPRGLTAADFNSDGRMDLAAANALDNTVSVFLANAEGVYDSKMDYAAGSVPTTIITADINGDGRHDLLIGSETASSIATLIGNGDGTFRAGAAVPTGEGPAGMASGDFNGDGRTDIAVANYMSHGLSVLLNGNGDAYDVAADESALTIGYLEGDSASQVTGNVVLPEAGANGTEISWTSSEPATIGNDGTVARPDYIAGDAAVTLTARIAKGTQSAERSFVVTVIRNNPNDEQAVSLDSAALAIGYADGDSAEQVAQSVTLPIGGNNGTSIAWSSDNTAIIESDGTVVRPLHTGDNEIVVLTATISKGAASDQKLFTLTVLKQMPTADQTAVADDKEALEIGYMHGDSSLYVRGNIALPITGSNGSAISWSSSNDDVIGSTGTVNRPAYMDEPVVVVLTATLVKGDESDQKQFALTVIPSLMPDSTAAELDRAALTIGFADGESASQVKGHLSLPSFGDLGTEISWASSDPSVIGSDGSVTRPSYEAGDAVVALTATISKGEASLQRTFNITVISRFDEAEFKGYNIPLFDPYGNEDRDGGISGEINIGFPFTYFGREFQSVYAQANGFIAFAEPASGMPNENDLIAPFGDDLDNATILARSVGTGPNRKFIVQWTDVDIYDEGLMGTFQAILYESSGDIQFQYRALDSRNPYSRGGNALIGLMSQETMVVYSQYEASLYEDKAVRFVSHEEGYIVDAEAVYDPVYLSGAFAPHDLTALSLSGVEFVFDENIDSYTANVPNDVEFTSVSFKTAFDASTVRITINDTEANALEPLTLSVGANEIKLVVAGQGSEEADRTYTVNVQRASASPDNEEPGGEPGEGEGPGEGPNPGQGSEGPGQEPGAGAGDGAGQGPGQVPASGTFEISSNEQSEWTLANEVKIMVPAGAVPSGGSITVTVVPVGEYPDLDNLELLSSILEFKSSTGRTFGMPLEITFHYNSNQVDAGNIPVVYYYNELFKRWMYIGGVVKPDGTVTIRINHFTKFAVFEYKPTSFSDMDGHWSTPYIERLTGRGVLSGYPDGSFRPEQSITRAQVAVMMGKALMLPEAEGDIVFTDQAAIPSWAEPAVASVATAGFMQGYERQGGKAFLADRYVTRAEMAVIIAHILRANEIDSSGEAAHFTDEGSIPAWAKPSALAAASAGILTGYEDGAFRANNTLTRAEASAIFFRLLEALYI